MAYDPNNLSALAYANGFTLWHYRTADEWPTVVVGNNYFGPAAGMLREGDFIFLNTGLGTADILHVVVAVLTNANGVVEVG